MHITFIIIIIIIINIVNWNVNDVFFGVFLQTLPTLEKEVTEWEHKYKALSSLKNLQNKLEKLKEEFIWALISEQEKVTIPFYSLYCSS